MKVILISKVKNLGNIGDIVVVKNGYGKNFLIPNKKAILYSVANYKVFESKRKEFEAENLQNLSVSERIKEQIVGKDIVIIENASDDGRLYGSVNTSVIAAKINEIIAQKALNRSNIFLSKPIKEIGLYEIKLHLHSDVEVQVRLIVTRSESEIETLLNDHKKKSGSSNSSKEDQKPDDQEQPIAEEAKPAPKTRKKAKSTAA